MKSWRWFTWVYVLGVYLVPVKGQGMDISLFEWLTFKDALATVYLNGVSKSVIDNTWSYILWKDLKSHNLAHIWICNQLLLYREGSEHYCYEHYVLTMWQFPINSKFVFSWNHCYIFWLSWSRAYLRLLLNPVTG